MGYFICQTFLLFFSFLFLIFFYFLFIYFWLRWVSAAVHRLSPAAANEGTPHRNAQASHCSSLSRRGAQAPGAWASVAVAHLSSSCGAQAQQLWRMGLVAPRHVGSSWTRAQTHVPCISRRTPNHCATREVLLFFSLFFFSFVFFSPLPFSPLYSSPISFFIWPSGAQN